MDDDKENNTCRQPPPSSKKPKDNWAQCDKCKEWIVLEPSIDPSSLPKTWYCSKCAIDTDGKGKQSKDKARVAILKNSIVWKPKVKSIKARAEAVHGKVVCIPRPNNPDATIKAKVELKKAGKTDEDCIFDLQGEESEKGTIRGLSAMEKIVECCEVDVVNEFGNPEYIYRSNAVKEKERFDQREHRKIGKEQVEEKRCEDGCKTSKECLSRLGDTDIDSDSDDEDARDFVDGGCIIASNFYTGQRGDFDLELETETTKVDHYVEANPGTAASLLS